MGPILTPMHQKKNLKHAGQICKTSVQAAMQWPGDQKPKNFSQTRQRQSEYYYYNCSISTCRLLLLYRLFSFEIVSPEIL